MRERKRGVAKKHTFSSAEHMILVSVSVATVPLCLLRSTTAAPSLRPTCEMRVSGGIGRAEEGRIGEGKRGGEEREVSREVYREGKERRGEERGEKLAERASSVVN